MSEEPHSSKTAPIDEYRVLWTTQKKQKLKKWHDGFLRFHKFNKRMLVYDDARHLVADMYLRGRDAIGEGDDLEFEHHLVTIEDFKGTVVQDLTPIFSPAAQRKQLLQAGNALLNSPTPNQANRHGPWGPGTSTSRAVQQQSPVAAGKPPQTPLQRRPTCTPSTALQQSIWAINSSKHPYQNSPPCPQLPNTPAIVHARIGPPQKLSTGSRPNPPSILHPPDPLQSQDRPSSQHQEQRQPWRSLGPLASFNNWSELDSKLSPSRQLNSHPPAPLRVPQAPSQANNVSSRLHPPNTSQRPTAAPDIVGPTDAARFSSEMKSSLLPVRPTNIFSHPIPSRANKDAPDVTINICGGAEFFGSPPRPVSMPPARQKSAPIDTIAVLGLDDPRASRPPPKPKTTTIPENPHQRSLEVVGSDVDIDVNGPGKDSSPRVFRPTSNRKIATPPENPQPKPSEVNIESPDSLVIAGTLRLAPIPKRKRNSLLCQEPLDISETPLKELAARNGRHQSARNDPVKKSKMDSQDQFRRGVRKRL